MADHFSPVLYVFGALYRLAATPAWFFAAQALAIGGHRRSRCGRWPVHARSAAVARHAAGGAQRAAAGRRPVRLPPEHAGGALHRRDAPRSRCRTGRLAAALAAVARRAVPGRPRARARRRSCWWRPARAGPVGRGRGGRRGRGQRRRARAASATPTAGPRTSATSVTRRVQALLHPWDVGGAAPLGQEPVDRSCCGCWPAGVAVVVRPRWLLGRSWSRGCRCCSPDGRAPACPGTTTARRWRRSRSAGPWRLSGASRDRTERWARAARGRLVARARARARAREPAVAVRARSEPGVARRAAATTGATSSGPGTRRARRCAVSADQRVLPHLSHREHAYLYPIPFARGGRLLRRGEPPRPGPATATTRSTWSSRRSATRISCRADRLRGRRTRWTGYVVLRRGRPDAGA